MRLDSFEILLKLLSQLLVAAAGVSVLFSKDGSTYSPAIGRRRLTATGWLQVAGISSGLLLFGVSEFVSQAERTRATQRTEAQTALLKEQLKASTKSVDQLKTLTDQQKQVIEAQAENARDQRAIRDEQDKQLGIAVQLDQRTRSTELSRLTLKGLNIHWSTVVRLDSPIKLGEWSFIAYLVETLHKKPVRTIPAHRLNAEGQGVGDTGGWLAKCSPRAAGGAADCWVQTTLLGLMAGSITNPTVPAEGFFQRTNNNSTSLVWWGKIDPLQQLRPLGPRFELYVNGRELASTRHVSDAFYSIRRLSGQDYSLEADLQVTTDARYDELEEELSFVADAGRWRLDSRDRDAQFSVAAVVTSGVGAVSLRLQPKFARDLRGKARKTGPSATR